MQSNIYEQYSEDYKFKNPFFNATSVKRQVGDKTETIEVRYLKNYELKKLFSRLLVLCQQNDCDSNITLILEDELTFPQLVESSKKLILREVPFALLSNLTHHKSVNAVSDLYLQVFNHNKLQLNESELVVPLLELKENKVKTYCKQFGEYQTLPEFYSLRVLNDYYHNYSKSPYVQNYLQNYLNNIKESLYWTINKNTHLNLTEKFLERDFFIGSSQKMTDEVIKRIAQKLMTMEEDGGNYLKHIYKRKEYTDAASAIKQRGFILYHLIKPENYKFTNDEICEFYESLKLEKEKFDLLTSMTVSKEYCHLFVNNPKLLELAKPLISKYAPVFRYTMGYAWIIMYIEECIKKTYTTDQDRFVFKLDTASKLPYFPFSYIEPKKTPYLPILVGDKFLESNTNLWGIVPTKDRTFKISTQSEFNHKMNIFTTGDPIKNIFNGLNWNNIAISGSIIPACVPKLHPLQELFDEINPDKQFFRYVNEYYSDSDIDMMINIQDKFKFYDKVQEVFNTIRENVLTFNNVENLDLVKLEPNHRIAMFVNRNFITTNIAPKLNKTVDEIIQNIDTDEVRQIVYPNYILHKVEENKKYDEQTRNKYKVYFTPLSYDKLHIYYYKTQDELKKEIEENKTKLLKELRELEENHEEYDEDKYELENPKSEELDNEEFEYEIKERNDLFIKEGFKFKITSKLMHHSIELFQTKFEPFFSCVARFHLPCVRGYYNGSETVLLPSCVSAMMTMMNMDYKYFAGSKDPIEIINKYRNRGFGTFLNDKEKIKFVEYSDSIEKWKKLYNLNKKVKESVNSVLGAMDINVDFFKPRKILPENYTEVTPVLYDYKKLNYEPIEKLEVEINNETFKEYQREFNLSDNLELLFTQIHMSLDIINKDGYVKPLNKWFIEYGYNIINHQTK
jgi:hypothetical protein